MPELVTIVVVPRDRFSSVIDCVKSIRQHTDILYRLVILDFGYSQATLTRLREQAGEVPFELVSCGRTIPLAAFREYLARIATPYVAWVDNDTYVTAGWMRALLDRAAQGARVILPVTLEREGLETDPRQAPL